MDIFARIINADKKKPRVCDINEDVERGLTSEHLRFLTSRSIPFLKHWPIEHLAANPQACMFHFFGYVSYMPIFLSQFALFFYYHYMFYNCCCLVNERCIYYYGQPFFCDDLYAY